MGALVQQQPAEHLQAVGVDIKLVEMVQTGVSTDFEFLGVSGRAYLTADPEPMGG